MSRDQKTLTRELFEGFAAKWCDFAYDPFERFLNYPIGRVRNQVIGGVLGDYGVEGELLDVGCGTGQLVIALREEGYRAFGIDISERMVKEARNHYSRKIGVAAEEAFAVGDIERFTDGGRRYGAITALGVLEYLASDNPFLERTSRLLEPGGFLLVECRNKLFNLASLNRYTLEVAENDELKLLLEELDEIPRYSPIADEQIPEAYAQMFVNMQGMFTLEGWNLPEEIPTATPAEVPYPQDLVRRQLSPLHIRDQAADYGLTLRHLIFYHIHPCLPRYEPKFAHFYNRMSVAMQPLGYTSIGATTGSAYIACFEKTSE